jgi:membrane protein
VGSQSFVAKYNALYAGFAALPIFFVWTYLSWNIVLLGAVLAASVQNEVLYRQQLRAKSADVDLREALGLAVVGDICARFLAGQPRPTATDMVEARMATPVAVDDVLSALVRAHIVAGTGSGRETTYAPAADLDHMRAADVVAALRRDPASEEGRLEVERELGRPLVALVAGLQEELRSSPHNVTLRALAGLVHPRVSVDVRAQPVDADARVGARHGAGEGDPRTQSAHHLPQLHDDDARDGLVVKAAADGHPATGGQAHPYR